MFPHASVSLEDSTVKIDFRDCAFLLKTTDTPHAGGKVTCYEIPEALWRQAADVRAGGGAVNSAIALALIASGVRARILDAACADRIIARRLAYPGMETRFLGCRAVARNAVLGDRCDQLVVRSPIERVSALSVEQLKELAWLMECPCVLANSVKDVSIMERLVRVTARGPRLYAVLTGSLPADFVVQRVLPCAHAIFAGWDEVGHVTRLDAAQNMDAALAHIEWLALRAPQAMIFLTMGKEGALVVGPGCPIVHHVRLDGPSPGVQSLIRRDPTRVCGAGDAFAAGAFVALETRVPLVSGGDGVASPVIRAGLAGCAAAVRWLGRVEGLRVLDFELTRLQGCRACGVA